MTRSLLGLILASVSCTALAQVALKYGMSRPAVQAALGRGPDGAAGGWRETAAAILLNPAIWAGGMLFAAGAVVWLFVLARVDVSVAYAFVALGIVLTVALGCALFGEPFTATKVAGTALVMLGLWVLARPA